MKFTHCCYIFYFCSFQLVYFAHLVSPNQNEIETKEAEVGHSLRISYISMYNQLIEYCIWTPPDNRQRNNAIPFLSTSPFAECGLTLARVSIEDFGDWKFIALIKPSIEFIGNHSSVVEGAVKVVKVKTLTNGRKDTKSQVPVIHILEAIHGVLDLTEDETNVTCCIESISRMVVLQLNIDGDMKFAETAKPIFLNKSKKLANCIHWSKRFEWKDNGKRLTCEESGGIMRSSNKVPIITASALLNINFAPKILNNGGSCGWTVKFENSTESEFVVKYSANPLASVVWKRIMPNDTDRVHPYIQVAAVNITEFPTELRERESHKEAVIKFRHIPLHENLQFLLSLSNNYGKCQTYLNVRSAQSTKSRRPSTVLTTTAKAPKQQEDVSIVEQTTTKRTILSSTPLTVITAILSNTNNTQVTVWNGKPIITRKVENFSPNIWTTLDCCIAYEPNATLNFQLDKSPITDNVTKTTNGWQRCIHLTIQFSWNDNEKLLRCRSSVNNIFGQQDSIFIFLQHKPELLHSPISEILSTDEKSGVTKIITKFAGNPIPKVTWQVQNIKNEECVAVNGTLNEFQKFRYSSTLNLNSTVKRRCGSVLYISMKLENEHGMNEQFKIQLARDNSLPTIFAESNAISQYKVSKWQIFGPYLFVKLFTKQMY